MYRIAALTISILLHPLLMATVIFFCLFNYAPLVLGPVQNQWILLGLIFSGSYLVPIFLILTLYNLGIVKDIKLDSKKERRWPMIASCLVYIGFTYILSSKVPMNMTLIMMGITFALVVVTVIMRYWKISAHTLGIGGTSAFLILTMIHYGEAAQDLLPVTLILVILTGFLISARLYLKVHTPAQIVAGMGLGIFVALGAFYL